MAKRIYLGHSSNERVKGKIIQKQLEVLGYEVYNPFYPPEPREDIIALDIGKSFPWNVIDEDTSRWIVETDLDGIDSCDLMFAVYPDDKTIGIPCEMMYCWMETIPVISVVPESMKGHPWIIHLSMATFTDIKKAFEYLQQIL